MTEHEKVNKNDILGDLSNDYAEYMNIDTNNKRNNFDEKLESLMTKLDEYQGLVDMIRSDTTLCLNKTLPQIYSKGKALEILFDRIDKLETFVKHVKDNMSEVEVLIDQAESELATKSPVAKFFTSLPKPGFLGRQQSSPQTMRFTKPDIFSTDDFLKPLPEQTAEPATESS